MWVIINTDDYRSLIHTLRTDMDGLTALKPKHKEETPAQRIHRQDSLISLALNRIHETHGPTYLTDNQDMGEVFNHILSELIQMNKDTVHAPKWAEMASESKSAHRGKDEHKL